MTFLAPAFLALAALAGVPLLVHLLRRRLGRTVEFPALRYLMRMEKEHSRDLRLKNRLLLILRLVIVLAIALAAARPLLRWAGMGKGHSPIALAVVVDNSLSTGVVLDGRVLFDSLRNETRRLLHELTPDDRAWLVSADGRVMGGDIGVLEAALDKLEPFGGRGDLRESMARALQLARSGTPRTAVAAVVSDGQTSSFRSDSLVNAGDVPVLMLQHSFAFVANRAVTEARPEPLRWTPDGEVNLALISPDSTAWRLVLGGRTVSRGVLPASVAGAPARAVVKAASASGDWVRGSVELEADALRADDVRWFAVRAALPPSVVVRSEGGPFLAAAVATLIDEGRLASQAAGQQSPAASRGSGESPARQPVMISGAEAAATRLPVLLAAPRDPVMVGEANRQLERLGIPWRFGAVSRTQALARPASRSTSHDSVPVLSRVFDGTAVRLHYPLAHSPGSVSGEPRGPNAAPDTLATVGGVPWAVAGPDYVLLGSPIDPEATDLPLNAAFLPWLLETLSHRLGNEGRIIETSPGRVVSGLRGITALETPEGDLLNIQGDRMNAPARAGVYFLRRLDARVGALVVNGEASESVLDADSSSLRLLVSGKDIHSLSDGSEWRSEVFARASGGSLVVPLLLLALVALLAETWVSRH